MPILITGGKNDLVTNHDFLMAWEELFTGACETIYFPGDHFFINSSRVLVINKIKPIASEVITRLKLAPGHIEIESYNQ